MTNRRQCKKYLSPLPFERTDERSEVGATALVRQALPFFCMSFSYRQHPIRPSGTFPSGEGCDTRILFLSFAALPKANKDE